MTGKTEAEAIAAWNARAERGTLTAEQVREAIEATDMFPDRHFYDEGFAFDTKVMKDALKPFEIYKLNPYMCIDGDRCMLSAHDKDVSMRVLFMGVKRR